MAVASAIIAAIGLAVSVDQQQEARRDQKRAVKSQENARAEQAAQNSAEAAQAARQQAREARIKRAQILQASENSGTAGSSGELGAVGGMNTALGSNFGLSQANIGRSQRIGTYMQQSADFNTQAANHQGRAQLATQTSNFVGNIFGQVQKAQTKADAKYGSVDDIFD